MHIGEKIKKIRKEKNLTQKMLGERCGMPDSQIRQYESGKITPKFQQIARIAAGLDVSTDYLLEGTEQGVITLDISMIVDRLSNALRSYNHDEEYRQQVLDAFISGERPRKMHDDLEPVSPKKFRAVFRYDENAKRRSALNAAFDKLNDDGQKIAVDQVELLTEIPKYQKGSDTECPTSQNEETPTGSESATAATPPESK